MRIKIIDRKLRSEIKKRGVKAVKDEKTALLDEARKAGCIVLEQLTERELLFLNCYQNRS